MSDIDFSKKKKKNKTKFQVPVDEAEIFKETMPEEFDIPIDYTNRKKKRSNRFMMEYVEPDSVVDVNGQLTEMDYNYEELLERIFNKIKEKNPDQFMGERRRLRMVPPSLARIGTKKTLFANFLAITRMIHREPQHVMQFLLNEMGTTGSIDQNSQLLIRGRYMSKQIETLLKNYCRAYVICKTCQLSDTKLSKDSRLLFLICNSCGSKYSVDSHTAGFQAVTTKRAAIRAKTQ